MRLIIYILLPLFLLSSCHGPRKVMYKSKSRGHKVRSTNPNGFGYGNDKKDDYKIDYHLDSDGDGIPDYQDANPNGPDEMNLPMAMPDHLIRVEEVMASPEMISEDVEYSPSSIKIVEVSNNKVSTSTTSGGHIAYKIPTEMSVRSTYQVIVRISKSTVNIYENLNGDVMTSSIPISETMEVKVIDPSPSDNKMFEVIPDNQPIQLVENNENVTQWTFNVTPLRAGKSKLKVVVSIVRNGLTKEVVYEDEVKVKSDITKTIPYFIATYWQWLLTTIVIPLIVWFYKRKKKDEE